MACRNFGIDQQFSGDRVLGGRPPRDRVYPRGRHLSGKSIAAAAVLAHDSSMRCTCVCDSEIRPRSLAISTLGHFQIVSASPERYLNVGDGEVEARPIKGTRQRTARPEADLFAGDELLQSEKDRAENVMIVDLLRNDLSRVCTADSVRVTQLCRLETYEYVQHWCPRSRTLAPANPIDLLRAAFPGGSITGAPKVRAMQIIAELEPTARGAYCGSLGYLGFDGTLDTEHSHPHHHGQPRLVAGPGRRRYRGPVGPEREYEETWHKAEGLLRALRE